MNLWLVDGCLIFVAARDHNQFSANVHKSAAYPGQRRMIVRVGFVEFLKREFGQMVFFCLFQQFIVDEMEVVDVPVEHIASPSGLHFKNETRNKRYSK